MLITRCAIHLTKISGLRFEYCSSPNRSRRSEWSRSIPLAKSFALFFFFFFNGGSRINFAYDGDDDFENNYILEDDDDIVLFSSASCFMRRSLTRITGYFEQTVPRYLVDEFRQHFRMTEETFESL